eukprot:TRINITY_DN5246_c0_g1_i1.p1 TRINITY_DN5246_c0_g1~~TRINITY_DN5246_c0_g1_i1.p1  ORF type:complete len:279 (+),score=43.39 TRINITY_DN5246_c0_g1_i1:13-849(+)
MYCYWLLLLLLLLSLVAGQDVFNGTANNQSAPKEITLSIYSYLPVPSSFKDTISSMWQDNYPNISLKFIEWDCYNEEESAQYPTADVFIFDAMFLHLFVKKGVLLPLTDFLSPDSLHDFYPFAVEAGRVNDQIYGLPQMACTTTLFHRREDTSMNNINSIEDLVSHLHTTNKEFIWKWCGGGSCSAFYLVLLQMKYGYNSRLQLPEHMNDLDGEIISRLRDLSCVSNDGPLEAFFNRTQDILVHFTEGLHSAKIQEKEDVIVQPFPFQRNQTFIPFFC